MSESNNIRRKNSTEVYEVLKDDIQYLLLQPGSILREAELIERFGVSRTPIREALIRLSTDALVSIYPQNGTFVSKIDFKRAQEVAYMRHLLDSDICMELCRRRAPVRDAVDEALYFMSVAAKKQDTISFIRQDDRFHAALFTAADHTQVWAILENAQTHNNRVRVLDMARPETLGPSLEEHLQIVECITNGDEQTLQGIMSRHHDHADAGAREALFRTLYPAYFETGE